MLQQQAQLPIKSYTVPVFVSELKEEVKSKLDAAFEKASAQPPALSLAEGQRILIFRPYIDPMSIRPYKPHNKGYYFKNYNGMSVSLIRYTLEDNGFREATDKQEWSVCWACSNIKSTMYQSMGRFQKINHFPKSTEITRKDNMYRNLAYLKEKHGE